MHRNLQPLPFDAQPAVSLKTRCMDAKLGATKERIHMTTP